MKKANVEVGGTYTAKISDRVVEVRITSENRLGGWNATNLATGKQVRIKTAQRLRGTVQAAPAPRRPKPAPVAEPAPAPTPEPQRTTKQPTGRRPGLLTAAAQVLAISGEPMNARQMVRAVEAAGLWSSPAGKTPHATLASAIVREITRRGEESRFRKVARGQFAAKTVTWA